MEYANLSRCESAAWEALDEFIRMSLKIMKRDSFCLGDCR